MLGFWLVNLLPPGRPAQFDVKSPCGTWEFRQAPNFNAVEQSVVKQGACANTYSMSIDLPAAASSAAADAAFAEALPLCLASSFATGATVTPSQSLPASLVQLISAGSHFPRQRGIPHPASCVGTISELVAFQERFVARYSSLNPTEKLFLLGHFYLDTWSCWSLENMYLSGSTMLQIIAATEEATGRTFAKAHAAQRTGNSSTKPAFFDYLAGAADRVNIAPLSHDVVKIRNSLIHDGTLKGTTFPAQGDAAQPIAEALRWVDAYVYALLGLGAVPVDRHSTRDLEFCINSISFE